MISTPAVYPNRAKTAERVLWILRIGVAGCFIGHGAFGFITKAGWVPYFGFVGIPSDQAYRLMPIVGTMDVSLGLLTLFFPLRVIFLHLVVWGIWTASLRPLTGDSIWELVERAGNYGVPFAMLLLTGPGRWFSKVRPRSLEDRDVWRLTTALRTAACLLLIGHGALALEGKALLLRHHAAIGLGSVSWFGMSSVQLAGWVEIGLGAAMLVVRSPALFIAAFAWKLGTELLFPISGDWWFEFIERAGSYAAPLALAFLAPFMVARAPSRATVPTRSAVDLTEAAPQLVTVEAPSE